MKTAAKIFLILGMVLYFYLIFPIVLGVIAIKKLEDEKSTYEDIRLWGILSLFLVSPLGGVFMLLIKPEELGGYTNENRSNTGLLTRNSEVTNRLLELKKLFDDGIIDSDTYIAKRESIAKEL